MDHQDALLARLAKAQRVLSQARQRRDDALTRALETCNAEQVARASGLTPQAVRSWRQRRKRKAAEP